MAELTPAQRQDMAGILKTSAQYEMGNAENAGKIAKYIRSKGMMTSSIGRAYLQRLVSIASGTKDHSCLFCRTERAVDGILCNACMNKYSGGKLKIKNAASPKTQGGNNKGTVQKLAEKVDKLAGGEGNVELKVRDLFKDVFKHHTMDEAEQIFIVGTETTTPVMKDISSNWPTPWLYSRVGLWLLAAFLILEISWKFTANINLLPGMMFVGSCIVPFAVMIFFFETNVPQNISIFRTVLVFFVGGCASLLSTLILFMIVPVGDLTFFGAIMVGIIEEVGKMVIVAFFISKMPDCLYILNGLLIGSAVGAGFAVFESAGYAFQTLWYESNYSSMVNTINLRAILSPGGHVTWAAITGAALMIALGGKKFSWNVIKDVKFLRLFVIPIILHAIWDMPFGTMLIYPVLIIAVWVVILVLIHNGLKEVEKPFV